MQKGKPHTLIYMCMEIVIRKLTRDAASAAPEERNTLLRGFAALNRAWIERYFRIEPCDERIFADPEGVILQPGGTIFTALHQQTVVGCCALIPHPAEGTWEMAKMAVAPDAQRHGIASQLAQALIAEARNKGVSQLFLEANTRLEASVHLYEKLGFRAKADYQPEYERCDLFMTLDLTPD